MQERNTYNKKMMVDATFYDFMYDCHTHLYVNARLIFLIIMTHQNQPSQNFIREQNSQ